MRYRMLLIVVLLAITFSGASAQDAETWYWAWDVLPGQLTAYNLAGETNVLIDGGFDADNFVAWRIDEQTEFAMVSIDGEGQLYRLTPTEAQLTTISDANPISNDVYWRLVAHTDRYLALIASDSMPAGAGVLVDMETNTGKALEWKANYNPQHAGFSADGAYFRYMGRNPEDDEQWTIREVKTETGAERVIYTINDEFFPTLTTDTHGEQWIYPESRGITIFIPVDGEPVTQIDEIPRFNIYSGDGIYTYDPLCAGECVLDWQPTADAPVQNIALPESYPSESATYPAPIRPIGDTQLLTQLGDEFWLLGLNGDHQMLGYFSPFDIITPRDELVSPDGRYMLVNTGLEEGAGYKVVDVQTGESVLDSDPEREYHIITIYYRAGGLIVSEDLLYFQFYRYSDGQVFDLGEHTGIFFDALADGSLLYILNRPDEERPIGIYRYEPDTDSYTLIAAEIHPLYSIDLSA